MNIIESQQREFQTREENRIDFDALKAPFHPSEIEWRIQIITQDKKSCLLLPYIQARAIMTRLYEVVGPQYWWSEYHRSQVGEGLECRLSIKVGDQIITKIDAAPQTKISPLKGAYSDSLKRAAVHFGIGRYLYYMDAQWQPVMNGYGNNKPRAIQVREHNKHIGHCVPPYLPDHFLPEGFKYFSENVDPDPVSHPVPIEPSPELIETEEDPKLIETQTKHDPSWGLHRSWFCAKCKDFGGYNAVAEWCESRCGARPSAWSSAARTKLIQALETGSKVVGE